MTPVLQFLALSSMVLVAVAMSAPQARIQNADGVDILRELLREGSQVHDTQMGPGIACDYIVAARMKCIFALAVGTKYCLCELYLMGSVAILCNVPIIMCPIFGSPCILDAFPVFCII